MPVTVTPVQDDVFTALRAFLLSIVPAGTIVLRGPVNRSAQPTTEHIVIEPMFRKRLRTNEITDNPPPDGPNPNGTADIEQGTQLDIQVDFYGDNLAPTWMDIFTTLFRDETAVIALAPTCAPLYADEGRQIPLTTGEEQYLERWMVLAALQYNPVTTVTQQYADTLEVTLINVDEAYPP